MPFLLSMNLTERLFFAANGPVQIARGVNDNSACVLSETFTLKNLCSLIDREKSTIKLQEVMIANGLT